jgi:hypothetical protein
MKPTPEEIQKAFLEILEGNANYAMVKHLTGLPDARCKEIVAIYKALVN